MILPSQRTADSGTGLCWIHLDYSQSAAHEWLHTVSWLDPIIRTNLVDDDTRPRSFTLAEGLFLSLRGVNLNPGADPEDMIAVRMWANKHCIITSNRRRLLSLEDIRTSLDSGAGPRSAASFVTLLIERIALRAETVVEQIENDFEEVEDRLSIGDDAESRALLAQMRRQAIRLRRFFSPQRTALEHLLNDSPGWFVKRDKLHIRESIDKFNRYVEELDSLRDRAIVAQEEFISRLSETLNKRVYLVAGGNAVSSARLSHRSAGDQRGRDTRGGKPLWVCRYLYWHHYRLRRHDRLAQIQKVVLA